MEITSLFTKIIISKILNQGFIMSIKWLKGYLTNKYPINKNEIVIMNEINNIYLTTNNNSIDIYYNILNLTPYDLKLNSIKYKIDYGSQQILNNEEHKNIFIKCLNVSPKQYNFKKELNENISFLIYKQIKENINFKESNLDRICSSNFNIKLTFNFEYLDGKHIQKDLDVKYIDISINEQFNELNKDKKIS